MNRTVLFCACAIAVVMMTPSRPASAAGPADAISSTYVLTAWTVDKGAPSGDIWAMAQDRLGYLWLGTRNGLVRFDGFEFVPWGSHGEPALPGSAIQALVSARDGSLWLGFGDVPGPVRIREGRVTDYSTGSAADGGISALLEDQDGTLWAGGRAGLLRFSGEQWEPVGAAEGMTTSEVYSLYADQAGTLWVGTAAGVFRRAAGGTRFELVDAQRVFVQSFAEDAEGGMWAGHTENIVISLTSNVRPGLAGDVRLPTPGWRLLRGRKGRVWIAALGGGLLRLVTDPATGRANIERVAYEHTMTGSPRSLFQDEDNNIWVGMRGGGLLRVSEAVVRTDTRLAGLTNDGVRALTATPEGSVWVATGHSINVFTPTGHSVYDITQTMALHTDAQGQVWAATHEGLGRIVDGRLVPMRLPRTVRFERVTSLTSDPQGRLWLCSVDEGVLRVDDGAITDFSNAPDIGSGSCSFAYADREGRIWLGFSRGGVSVYDGGKFRTYGRAQGLAGGTVMAIYQDTRGAVWIATSSGLSRFLDGAIVTVGTENGLHGGLVPSIIEDGSGALWVGVDSGAGLIRFDPSELDRVAADQNHRLQYVLYDASDGLQGVLHWWSHPSAVRVADGHLWFVTGTGIAVVDPPRLPARVSSRELRIARVIADGTSYPSGGPLRLPARTSNLQIEYTALALSGASKLRFRYMLEGLNPDWVDAGARRVASYTDLPPGDYRFRLGATMDGAWDERETVLAFSVLPPFYRTPLFYFACGLAVALSAWAYWSARMRAIQRHFAIVLDERTRVSREIHDTLLQDLGAIRLKLEVLTHRVSGSDRSAGESLRALHTQVGRCIREARQSIWELRSRRRDTRDLVAGFQGLAGDVQTTHGVRVDVSVHGAPWRCSHEAEEQLLRIGQEALNNAVRHGGAKRIEITVDYEPGTLRVRIVDDGSGFADSGGAAQDGHWGLLSMQERAESIGARFNISSQPGRGTSVEVVVPESMPVRATRVAL